jgi:Holliday junction resolvase
VTRTRTHYRTGADFERTICADLERRGFVTIRAAGSKGAAKVDVIAVNPLGVQLWIQAKTSGAIGPGEWNTLRMCAGWAQATPLVAEKGPRGLPVVYTEIVAEKVPYSRAVVSRLYTFSDVDIIRADNLTDTTN